MTKKVSRVFRISMFALVKHISVCRFSHSLRLLCLCICTIAINSVEKAKKGEDSIINDSLTKDTQGFACLMCAWVVHTCHRDKFQVETFCGFNVCLSCAYLCLKQCTCWNCCVRTAEKEKNKGKETNVIEKQTSSPAVIEKNPSGNDKKGFTCFIDFNVCNS